MRLYDILASDMVGRNSESRKIANNTYKVRVENEAGDEQAIAIKLHDTNVVTAYPDGSVKLDSGGWKTPTTKSRIDDALQMIGLRLAQVEGLWQLQSHAYNPNFVIAFGDGMVFTNYNLIKPKVLDNGLLRDEKGMRLQVREYAKLISQDVPLDNGKEGPYCDAWDHEDADYDTGEAPAPYDRTDLLMEHIRTGRFCMATIESALDFVGMNSFIRNAVWYGKPFDYLGRERLCEALGRYLCYRLGLVPVRFVWRSR